MAAAHHCRDVNARPENLLRLLSRIVSVLLIYCCPRTDWGGRHEDVSERHAIWLTRAQAGAPRSLRRQRAHVLARAACVAGLLTGAAAGLAPADAPPTVAAAPAAPAALSTALAKEEARLASAPASRAVAAVPAASTRAAAVARPVDPRFAALPTQARFAKAGEPAVNRKST